MEDIRKIIKEVLLEAEDCTDFFDLDSINRYVEFDKPLYSIVAKRKTAKLLYLTPKQYIYRIAHSFGGLSYEDTMIAVNSDRVDKYAEDMERGDKFPVVYYTKDGGDQEGRHRALAAMKLGCEKMPVIEFVSIDNNQMEKIARKFENMSFDDLNKLFIKIGFEKGITNLGYGELQQYIKFLNAKD